MKQIKDPIYGYIQLQDMYVSIIDTEEYQRLRYIKQTGYQALYPCALHNRFVHSLGVFHLGQKGFKYLMSNIEFPHSDNFERLENTFLLACLLHDIGHSPFSHVGEQFYQLGINFQAELCKAIQSESFVSDISLGFGNPHEAMSVLVGLDLLQRLEFPADSYDLELFARCIIGKPYTSAELTTENALINLLNGNTVDVDKLDYLIRDAYETGFNNISLDYERLLSGYTIHKSTDVPSHIVFKRSALSVIENVTYAKDLEARWIQNNPTVLYDCKINEIAIQKFDKVKSRELGVATVLSKEALSAEGIPNGPRLLCDADIFSFIKNNPSPGITEQCLNRAKRLKPIWKTEAAFDEVFLHGISAKIAERFYSDLDGCANLVESGDDFAYNSEFVKKVLADLQKATEDDPKQNESAIASYKTALKLCKIFEDFNKAHGLSDFQYAVLFVQKFTSNFRNFDVGGTYVELDTDTLVPMSKILKLKANKPEGNSDPKKSKLFYIYTTPDNLKKCPTLCTDLANYLNTHYMAQK